MEQIRRWGEQARGQKLHTSRIDIRRHMGMVEAGKLLQPRDGRLFHNFHSHGSVEQEHWLHDHTQSKHK